jgi:hypothetical protein
MQEAIREGLRSLSEEPTYPTAEVRFRIAAWTARYSESGRACGSPRQPLVKRGFIFPRWSACENSLNADVLVQLWPVDANARAN